MTYQQSKQSVRRLLSLWLALLLVFTGIPVPHAEAATSIDENTIVIDYGDPEYSESGQWDTSTGLKGYNNSNSRYGYSNGAYARWTPELQPGTYRVAIYKIFHASSEPNGTIEVVHAGGTDTQTIDHQTGTAGWVVLGEFPFLAGSGGYVQYTRQSLGASTNYARTDAVMFERIGDLPAGYEPEPPTVQMTKPGSAAQVPVNSIIELTFSKPMNPSRLNLEQIQLRESGGGSVVDAVYNVIGDRVFTLQPNQPLKFEQSYTVTVSTDVEDESGQTVSGELSWSFTTELPTYIIDYGHTGYSEFGTWAESTGIRGYNNSYTRYGSSVGAYAQWTPELVAGTYRVSLYKTVHETSDSKGEIVVNHYAGTTTTVIDFTSGSPGWVDLGTYYFAEGTGGSVRNVRSGGFARADAVKFEKIVLAPEAQLVESEPGEQVEVEATFDIRFNKLMNIDYLNASNVSLLREHDLAEVPFSVEIVDAGQGIRIVPNVSLNYDTSYSLTISDALADMEGMTVTGTRSWTITTMPPDLTPPSAELSSPEDTDGIKVSHIFEITFNEAMNPSTLDADNIRLEDTAEGQRVAYESELAPGNRKLTIKPSTNLRYGAAYSLTIDAGVTDKAGNAIVPISWNMTTAEVSNPVKEFHVSPSGSDNNDGSAAAPFATIRKAQETVRTMNGNMEGDITVILHGGEYVLDETLRWTAEDSGTNGYWVKYVNKNGEHPVISGGQPIAGWSPVEESGMWKAPYTGQPFRQLYVNGNRAVRAKSEELFNAESFNEAKDGFIVSEDIIGNWRNADQIELSWYKAWRHSRAPVQSIAPADEAGMVEVTMKQPYFDWMVSSGYASHSPSPFGFHIENAFELLDQPGEWYLDTTAQEVYYWPMPGESMESAEAIAPQVQLLAEVKGTLDQPVSHIHLEGLTFRYGSWMQPSEQGISTIQGDIIAGGMNQKGSLNQGEKITGNIVVNAANDIRFERNRFEHMGAAGIVLENGASDVAIVGNLFTDISAAAIIVGDMSDAYPADQRQVTRRNKISDNVIYNVANEYWGSTGIFALYVEELSIVHNEMYDLPYSGISLGWGWSAHQSSGVMKNNLVEGNLIHHHMYKLKDGGGIYTLGKQPGTLITGNVVHDQIHIYGGVYLDEGSSEIEVTRNVTYNSPTYFHNNSSADTNIIVDNYFGVMPSDHAEAQLIYDQAGLREPYRDLLAGLPEPTAKPEEKGEVQGPERSDSVILKNNGPGYSEQGEWTDSGLTGHDGYSSTRYSISGNASATWRPNVNPGWYKVSVFKVAFSNSDPNAKIEIKSAGTTMIGYMDLTRGSSEWVEFGTHYFGEGTDGSVTMSRMTVPDDNSYGFARANAVRFEKVAAAPLFGNTGFEAGMDGWEQAGGMAELITDASRPAGEDQVLEVTAASDQPGIVVPGDAIWTPINAGDYAIGASIQATAGMKAGVALRYSGNGEYYQVLLNEPEDKLQLWKRQDTGSELLLDVSRTIGEGNWYRLKAKAAGGRLEVYVDNETAASLTYTIEATDSSIASGKPALILVEGSARYDEVGISAYLPEIDLGVTNVTSSLGTVAVTAPGGLVYTVQLPQGTTDIPVIGASPADGRASATVEQASDLSSAALIRVVSPDGLSSKQYEVKFIVRDDSDDDTSSPGVTIPVGESPSGSSMEVGSDALIVQPVRLKQDDNGTASYGVSEADWKKAVEQAPENQDGTKTIRLELETVPDAESYMQLLPASALSGGAGDLRIVVVTPMGTVSISNQMLQAGGALGEEIGIRIARTEPSRLPADVASSVGNRPVIDLSVWAGERQLNWSNDDAPVTVNIPYEPVSGEDTAYLTVWYVDESGNASPVPNGTYRPDSESVEFRTSHFSQYAVVWVRKSFDDLQASEWDWARNAVELLASRGIVNGAGGNLFLPSKQVTRSEFMVMLVRALELKGKAGDKFADVQAGVYYNEALRVARGKGIIEGFEDGSFRPNAFITREDMMVMVSRALNVLGIKLERAENVALDSFHDAPALAPYARDSVAELVGSGLIQGDGHSLHPKASATRAESAAFLHKLYQYLTR